MVKLCAKRLSGIADPSWGPVLPAGGTLAPPGPMQRSLAEGPSPYQSPRLAQQYVYPQTIVQPSLLVPSQLSSVSSPYLDYSAAYAQYASSAFEQYPYAASPSFLSYGYAPGSSAPAPGPGPLQQALQSGATQPTAFIQYPPQQVQPDRMQ